MPAGRRRVRPPPLPPAPSSTHAAALLSLLLLLLLLLLRPPAASALTVSTFNLLAAVHRSVRGGWSVDGDDLSPLGHPPRDYRESDHPSWWRPRAERLAAYVAEELGASDAVLLQEWWTHPDFEEVFDAATSAGFARVSHRRPGMAADGRPREDGMAVLVRRGGELEVVESFRVLTGPQRIGQVVRCRDGMGRDVSIGNVHLSYPGGSDPVASARRQAYEVHLVARAVAGRRGRRGADGGDGDGDGDGDGAPPPFWDGSLDGDRDRQPVAQRVPRRRAPPRPGRQQQRRGGGQELQIIGGDFNSDSAGLASAALEAAPYHYANCMSACGGQALCGLGGRVSLGVTHRTHSGLDVSVDQLLARMVITGEEGGEVHDGTASSSPPSPSSSGRPCLEGGGGMLGLGYLDQNTGARVVDCAARDAVRIAGKDILSDHRPVTATLHWPTPSSEGNGGGGGGDTSGTEVADGAEDPTTLHRGVAGAGGAVNGSAPALHPLQSPWDS